MITDHADLYKTSVESTFDGIAVLDVTGEFLLVNEVFADHLDTTPETLEGQTYGEGAGVSDAMIEQPDDLTEQFANAAEVAAETGQSQFRYEATLEVDGVPRVINNRVSAVRREDGSIVFVLISRDITPRKRRERQIEELHSSNLALNSAETREAVALAVTDAVEDVLGHPAAVVRTVSPDGSLLEPLARTDEAERLVGDLGALSVDDTPIGAAYRDGETILVPDVDEGTDAFADDPLSTLLIVPIGEYGTLSILHPDVDAYDDTDREVAELLAVNAAAAFERVEREAALRERERALARENERLEQFASVVSHDLRNPLNVAMGYLEQARENRGSETLDRVAAAHDRMATMIEDLLGLARTGRAVDDPEPVELEDLIESCWGSVETGDATLSVDDAPTIAADRPQLRQAIENLLRNAVEHGSTNPHSKARGDAVEHGGEDVTVRLGRHDDGFFLEDDGPGIPSEDRDRVFEYGVSSDDGSGLGLAIVSEVADAHGWDVHLEASAEGGARFVFTGVDGPS